MGRRRDLNGLPNSLEQRYFSTMFWWEKAYMADWIWNAANEKSVRDVVIDILNDTVEPKVLEIRPITVQLKKLRETIVTTLESNDFPTDLIVDAKFKIYISQKHKESRLLSCQAIVIDKNGQVYEGSTYTETAFETPFKVFQATFIERIKKIISK